MQRQNVYIVYVCMSYNLLSCKLILQSSLQASKSQCKSSSTTLIRSLVVYEERIRPDQIGVSDLCFL